MELKYLPCTEDDLEFVLNLKEQTMGWYIEKLYGWNEEIQRQKTLNEINKHKDEMRIILFEGKKVGVTTFAKENEDYVVGLTMIASEFQNKGIATTILRGYIAKAQNEKKRITIKTYKENPAQNLYKRLGFQVYLEDETHLYLEII